MIVIAHQIAVGLAGADLFQNPFLARFENARRGDENFRRPSPARAKSGHGLAIFFRVFKFAINRAPNRMGMRRFQLRQLRTSTIRRGWPSGVARRRGRGPRRGFPAIVQRCGWARNCFQFD